MNIRDKVIEILNYLGAIEIYDDNLLLVDDLGLDSLEMVTLLVMLEDEFQIELDESDKNPFNLQTIEDVIDLVEKYYIEEQKD